MVISGDNIFFENYAYTRVSLRLRNNSGGSLLKISMERRKGSNEIKFIELSKILIDKFCPEKGSIRQVLVGFNVTNYFLKYIIQMRIN